MLGSSLAGPLRLQGLTTRAFEAQSSEFHSGSPNRKRLGVKFLDAFELFFCICRSFEFSSRDPIWLQGPHSKLG